MTYLAAIGISSGWSPNIHFNFMWFDFGILFWSFVLSHSHNNEYNMFLCYLLLVCRRNIAILPLVEMFVCSDLFQWPACGH